MRGRQANGCTCHEAHSNPEDIVAALARCKHPEGQRIRLDAAGVSVPSGQEGLLFCCHCGAHQRRSDGAWVRGHLLAAAVHFIARRRARERSTNDSKP